MITIFNRKYLCSTFSMQEQGEIRTKLYAAGIPYIWKVINPEAGSFLGTSRSRTGSFGNNPAFTYEYVFYVHKQDYDDAAFAIR